MKKTVFFLLFVIPQLVFAQDADNLKKKAEQENSAQSWNDLAEYLYYKQTDAELLKKATDKSILIASAQNNKVELARAYIYLSDLYYQAANIKMYQSNNQKALDLLNNTKEYSLQEEALNNIATAYGEQDKIDSLIFYVQKAIRMNQQHKGKQSQLGNEYQNMSYAYSIKGQVDSSIFYTKKTINALNNAKDTLRMLDAYNQMAVIYVKNKNYPLALKYFSDALSIYDKVENKHNRVYIYTNLAAMYQKWGDLNKAIEFSRKAVNDTKNSEEKITYGKLLFNLGVYLYQNKNYQSSVDTLKLALPYIKNSHHYLGATYQTLASNYLFMKNIDSTQFYLSLVDSLADMKQFAKGELFYASKASMLALQSKYKEAVPYVHKFIEIDSQKELKDSDPITYALASEVLEKGDGDYKKALEYRKIASSLQDSLYKKESNEKLNEFYARYKSAEKDLEISKLNEEKQKILLNTILVVGVLLILTIVYVLYNRIKRLRLNQENQKNQIKSYLEGLENERSRLAKELHDNISNDIITLRMKLEIDDSDNASVIKDIRDLHTNVRNISHQLMPPIFKYTPLKDILRNYVDQQNQLKKADVSLYIADQEIWNTISSELSMEIYRIIQEAVVNAQKYAEATRIDIHLLREDNILKISIKDNGIGFNPKEIHTGLGLKTIKDRSDFINGTLTIESEVGKGTELKIVIAHNRIK